MKRLITLACLAATVSLTSGTAMADSIQGRLGVTGKLGLLIPADSNAEFTSYRTSETDAGFAFGGGLLYGIDNRFAAELDVTNSYFGSDTGDFDVTNISFGGQYRFTYAQDKRIVPYAGAGLDIIATDYDANLGGRRHVDTILGVHASGGVDFFIEKQVALTAETKIVLAPDADITEDGYRSGKFDPSSFSATVGIRYFFN